VKVLRSIADVGFAQASIVKPKGTTADITINLPYTKSTPPIEGSFVIACKNKDGNDFTTREMSIWETPDKIAMYMNWDIPHLMLKTRV